MNITMSLYTTLWSMPDFWLISEGVNLMLGDFLHNNATVLAAGTLSLSIIPALPSGSSFPTIPWGDTRASKLAKDVIRCFILEESKKEPALHAFLIAHCSHLLDMDTKDSGIPTNILDMNSPSPERVHPPVPLTPTFTKGLTSNLHGLAGCYAFLDAATDEILYIGSCINYSSRVFMHYDYLKDLVSAFYKGVAKLGGFQMVVFVPILASPNRISQFISANGTASLFAISMLRMITQYEVRLQEQALLMFYRPSLNSDQPVIFSFSNSKLYAPTREGSVPVRVIDSDGLEYSFPSIKQAKAFTALNESTITRSANCVPWCYSEALEAKVHFIIDSYPTKTRRATSADFADLVYDFVSLPIGEVFFLDKDLNLLPGSYKGGFGNALAAVGISKSKPGKYVNKEFLVLGKLVYMVFNPATDRTNGLRVRKLKAVDTKGIEPVQRFDSGKLLMDHFKMNRPFNSYITRGMLVNKRYRIYYDD